MSDKWGLQLCDKCELMTNHDDSGCLRCRGTELDEILYLDAETSELGKEFKQKQKQAILKLKDRWEREARIDEVKKLGKYFWQKGYVDPHIGSRIDELNSNDWAELKEGKL